MIDVRQRVFWTKYRLYDRQAIEYFAWLNRNQFLSRDELDTINWSKRQAIVVHAYESIPFYRKWFDQHGIHPDDLKTVSEWQQMPILTKKILREHFSDLVWSESRPRDRRLATTGGSTGVPLKLFHDKRHPMAALGWRMLGWWGVSPDSNAAFVYRLTRQSSRSQLLNAMLWWPTKRIWLDASHVTNEAIEAFMVKYNKLRPRILQGYAGAIVHLARHLSAARQHPYRPQAVWVTASPLSRPDRLMIESAFSTPVYDQYGCGEVFWIAAECKRQHGLHVFSDARHVEIVDADGRPCPANTEGQVIVTDLENKVFPLIRYQNDDYAALWDVGCDCGVNLPLMSPIKGRVTDRVILPDGSSISGEFLTTIFDDYPDLVQAFQILQHADMSLKLRVVLDITTQENEKSLTRIADSLRQKTGGQVPVTVERLDAIPHNRGKLQYVISQVTSTSNATLLHD